ncbi:MAG TPA: copper resistance CopC family protein [Actinomycetota bacterium]|nr:copper resistance CopC family protein [Actinomycetota bacterium]
MKTARVIAAAGTVLVLAAAPAQAHAERSASTPAEGARVGAAPETLQITFTEPPTGDAVAEVVDGCGRDVVTDVAVENLEMTATLGEGQPGRWTVNTNVISAVDGHNTRDRWTFTVRGEADCSAPESATPGGAAGDEEEEDGGSALPLLMVGGATLALIAVALVLRGRSS